MEIELYLDPHNIAAIFESITVINVSGSSSVDIYAPNINRINEWTHILWSDIQIAVAAVAEKGRDAVEVWMERLQAEIAKLRDELGEESRQVIREVQAKLAVARQETWQTMLSLLPPTISIQGTPVRLEEVTLEYELTTEAALEVSILKILDVTAGGSVKVGAKYSLHAAS